MPIIYAAAASNNAIFAEYPAKEHPKLAEVCSQIISQVPLNENGKKTFEEATYKFHYKSTDGHVYICVADKDTPLRQCHAFLESLPSLVRQDRNNPEKVLKERMAYHNNPTNDKLLNLKSEIDEVKVVMMNNINEVLERGEKLDKLADKSDVLAADAERFHVTSRSLKRAYCKKHVKLVALAVFLVVILIIIIVLIACNPNFSRCGNSS